MFNQVKKAVAFTFVAVFCLGLFSFKSINSNESNLGGAKRVVATSASGTSNAQTRRVVRAAKAVWNGSGKEVAKFVAYEVVSAAVEWAFGSSDEIISASSNVEAEAAYKLGKL